MVVIYHIFSYRLVPVRDGSEVKWLKEGVALFFAISGYVMVSSTGRRPVTPASFLWKRIKRIAPLYWVTTLCVAAAAAQPAWRTVVGSLFFLPILNPESGAITPPLLDVGWTLNFEMAFYLLFALSLLTPRPVAIRAIVVSLVMLWLTEVLLSARPPLIAYYGQSFLLDFAAGCLIAFLGIRSPAWMLPLGFFLLAMAPNLVGDRVLSATIPAALCLSSSLSLERSLKKMQPIVLMADASYALYLTHIFVIVGFLGIVAAGKGDTLTLVAALAACLVAGILVHRHIELPLKRLVDVTEGRLRSSAVGRRTAHHLLPGDVIQSHTAPPGEAG